MSTAHLAKDLKALGSASTSYAVAGPSISILERFPNPANLEGLNPSRTPVEVQIVAPEFTSLCPLTGQPDFAAIKVAYQPREWCVESKSFKLYLFAFRNHGEFHEACTLRILNDLVALLEPEWLVVRGVFTPRGGIPFVPTCVYRAIDCDTPVRDILARLA
jgi:7-cyano-7-deazaguanine reductase